MEQANLAPRPSGYQLAAVDFVSPTTGWVAATLDSGSYALLRTTDAGQSWSRQLTGATDQRTVYLRFSIRVTACSGSWDLDLPCSAPQTAGALGLGKR